MTLRIGVAGTGHWANIVHIPGLKMQKDVELVGIWGRSPEALAYISKDHGIRAYADFRAMLKDVDAVSFSLPPAVQADLAVIAASEGKHLLLEKPIAPTVAGAEALAAAVDRNKVASVVFFTRRYVPAIEQALETAKARPFTGARIVQHTEALLPGSPYVNSVWRQVDGGALWDLGPHALSVLLKVLGPIERIAAERLPDRINRFTATHRSGAVSEVSLSVHTPPGKIAAEIRFLARDGDYVLALPAFERPPVLAAAAGELAANARTGETRHRCDARFGLEVVRILAAADRSVAAGGAPIAI